MALDTWSNVNRRAGGGEGGGNRDKNETGIDKPKNADDQDNAAPNCNEHVVYSSSYTGTCVSFVSKVEAIELPLIIFQRPHKIQSIFQDVFNSNVKVWARHDSLLHKTRP